VLRIVRCLEAKDSLVFDWAIESESVLMPSQMSKAEQYLQKAEQFEAMAQKAQANAAKVAYEHLAWSYRQLGLHVSRGFQNATELDGLAERIVGSGKKAVSE
jgi:hypothetical protein